MDKSSTVRLKFIYMHRYAIGKDTQNYSPLFLVPFLIPILVYPDKDISHPVAKWKNLIIFPTAAELRKPASTTSTLAEHSEILQEL